MNSKLQELLNDIELRFEDYNENYDLSNKERLDYYLKVELHENDNLKINYYNDVNTLIDFYTHNNLNDFDTTESMLHYFKKCFNLFVEVHETQMNGKSFYSIKTMYYIHINLVAFNHLLGMLEYI